MAQNSDQFYSELQANQIALPELLVRDELFFEVPADWHVMITDIRNSTVAVLGGMHETVNLVATGSIVTVLNIVLKASMTVPFFFGGDGATFIVPSAVLGRCLSALKLYQSNVLANFNFDLRVGTIPVGQIYANGESLSISKYSTSGMFVIPVVLGNGLSYAEKLIKGADYLLGEIETANEELDLTGMQCRWDKIAPPENNYEIVTLLAVATKAAHQPKVFAKVMLQIDTIYGIPDKRQPISLPKLKLTTTFNKLETELRATTGHTNPIRMVGMWLKSVLGYFYFKTEKGRKYLRSMIEMSDTLVIDGKINTVISGTEAQRLSLQNALDKLEAEGEIVYGLYVSRESVMSCYVRDMEDSHIHFVDGGEGGYTKAAGLMKLKFQKPPVI
ncbi:MAG TPA: DUF3095 family protein [Pedobacter sp.]|nr:DUF3095 family protein [Pedobacter sp.]